MRTSFVKRHGAARPPAPHGVQPIQAANSDGEESLVVDQRSQVQPAQAVEEKLRLLLKNQALPLSMRRMTQAGIQRRHC